MTYQPTNRDFVNIAYNGPRSKAFAEVCSWLADQLQQLPEGKKLSTRKLLQHLGLNEHPSAPNALYRIRKENGLPAGSWIEDNTRRHFGNNLILWKRPDPMGADTEIDTSIF